MKSKKHKITQSSLNVSKNKVQVSKKFVSLAVIAFISFNNISSGVIEAVNVVNNNVNPQFIAAAPGLTGFEDFINQNQGSTDVNDYRTKLKAALVANMSQAFETKVDTILDGLTTIADLKSFANDIKNYDSNGSGQFDIVVTTFKDENPTTHTQTIVGYHINGLHGQFLVKNSTKNLLITGQPLNITRQGSGFNISANSGNGFSSDYANNVVNGNEIILKYAENKTVDPYAQYTPVHTHKDVVVYDVDGTTVVERGVLDYDTRGPVDQNVKYTHTSGKTILSYHSDQTTGKLQMGWNPREILGNGIISVRDSATLLEYKLTPPVNDAVYTPHLIIWDNLKPNPTVSDLAHFHQHEDTLADLTLVNTAFDNTLQDLGLSANEWKTLANNHGDTNGARKTYYLTLLSEYLKEKGISEKTFNDKLLQNLNLDPNNYHVELKQSVHSPQRTFIAFPVSTPESFDIVIRPGHSTLVAKDSFDKTDIFDPDININRAIVVYSKLNPITNQQEKAYSALKSGAHPMTSAELQNIFNNVFLKDIINSVENQNGHVHSLDGTLHLIVPTDLTKLENDLKAQFPAYTSKMSPAELSEFTKTMADTTLAMVKDFYKLEFGKEATQPDGSRTQINFDTAHITIDEASDSVTLNINDIVGTIFNNNVSDKIPVVYVQEGTHNSVPNGINPKVTFDPKITDPKLVVGTGIVATKATVPGTQDWKVTGPAVLITNPDGSKHWEIPANIPQRRMSTPPAVTQKQSDIPVVFVYDHTHQELPKYDPLHSTSSSTILDSTYPHIHDIVKGNEQYIVTGEAVFNKNSNRWEISVTLKTKSVSNVNTLVRGTNKSNNQVSELIFGLFALSSLVVLSRKRK